MAIVNKGCNGFTLAELLITLLILGEIATFTIPKLLNAQQNSRNQAIGKEAVATIAGAYSIYQASTGSSSSSKMNDLTPFLNYVALDTTSRIDYVPSLTYRDCGNSSIVCYRLHNGAMLWFWDVGSAQGYPFSGTSTSHAIEFFIDPDGVYSNSTTSPGKSAAFYLYYNGRISSRAFILTPTTVNGATYSANSTYEPDWFTW